MQLGSFDIVVVGAGFFGATIAQRSAAELGLKVCVLDKRLHLGGNAYSEPDPVTGIEVHRYGTHIFHTNSDEVWAYLRRFCTFTDYRHRVFTVARGRIYPMPINLSTMCAAFEKVLSPASARTLIAEEAATLADGPPLNLEDKAIAAIGRTLYELLIRGYTEKQWQTDPRELPPEIINRLPVRFTFNDRYFSDRYEGLPAEGYTNIFRRMLSHRNIVITLGIDYFDVKDSSRSEQLVVYTGPIDRYFNYRYGHLGWRTVDFEREVCDCADFQGTAVMNYADANVPFTRIHEFRHLHPERNYPADKTTIYREYSRAAGVNDEPYYPINTHSDRIIYEAYRTLAEKIPNVIFGGRLGTYRYLDMHQAIGAALKTFDREVIPFFQSKPTRLRVRK